MNFIKGGSVHAYLKGILQSIYTIKNKYNKYGIFPEYSVANHSLENNIAHATNELIDLRMLSDECSAILRDKAVPKFGLVRKSFGGSSTAVRQVVEGQSKRSRTAPEQDSKESRTRLEGLSNSCRSALEQHSNRCQTKGTQARNF